MSGRRQWIRGHIDWLVGLDLGVCSIAGLHRWVLVLLISNANVGLTLEILQSARLDIRENAIHECRITGAWFTVKMSLACFY